jgi:hypothetical protein
MSGLLRQARPNWAALTHTDLSARGRQQDASALTAEQPARRAFSSNSAITQCDAICKLAGIRPHAPATCTQVVDGPGLPLTVGRTLRRRAPLCSGAFTTPVTWQNSCDLSGRSTVRRPKLRPINETSAAPGASLSALMIGVSAGQRGGGCEIRTREGLPPTRFPTMLTTVHRGPPPSVTCPNMTGAVSGEQRRTEVNETETETGGWPAHRGSARLGISAP